MHMRLQRGAAAFFYVALDAAADDVFPRAFAALGFGHDVVERQFRRRHFFAAVLASAAVARVNISAIEFHILPRKFIVAEQANDSRHGDLETHGVNPLVTIGLEFQF